MQESVAVGRVGNVELCNVVRIHDFYFNISCARGPCAFTIISYRKQGNDLPFLRGRGARSARSRHTFRITRHGRDVFCMPRV